MGLVDEIYGASAVDATPPEAQRWAFFLDHGVKPVCTFVRRHDGGVWGPPRFVVAYPGAQPEVPPDPVVPWEPVLEDWLLAHRIPASSPANEAERIGYDLSTRLAVIERQYTTPAYTAVLLRVLYDHDSPLYIPLEKKLGALRPYEPEAADTRPPICEAIKTVVRDVTASIEALGYPPDQAKQIRGEAFAYYLRDRFELDRPGSMPTPQAG
ncbi:MAG TPA: hypothetical protein VFP84_30725 [Kofleriaceae bacterium]|nr:hypothetical protein [Kofleriaceae bacterium]